MIQPAKWLAAFAAMVLAVALTLGQAAAPLHAPAPSEGGTATLSTTTQSSVPMPSVPYLTEARKEITSLPQPVVNPKNATDLRAIQERVEAVVKYALPATVGVLVSDGQGSGVIVSKDGYVLTAGHVSGDPNKEVDIVFSNGIHVRGKALGANNGIDSGMVKITTPAPAGGYPFVPLGSAKDLPTGQWAIAMGHPGGYRPGRPPVVRLGRVLRVQRNRADEPQYIQTDCPLINGDSGGPVFDLDGRLIGINSRIGIDTRQNLHVPIDTFTQTWDRLADAEKWGDRPSFLTRRSERPDRSAATAPRLGVRPVDDTKGAMVQQVFAGTPAEGILLANDIVTRINGQIVRNAAELEAAIKKYKPGDRINVDVLRDSQSKRFEIVLAAQN